MIQKPFIKSTYSMRFFCVVESIIIKNFVGSSFKSPLMKSLFIGEDIFLCCEIREQFLKEPDCRWHQKDNNQEFIKMADLNYSPDSYEIYPMSSKDNDGISAKIREEKQFVDSLAQNP